MYDEGALAQTGAVVGGVGLLGATGFSWMLALAVGAVAVGVVSLRYASRAVRDARK